LTGSPGGYRGSALGALENGSRVTPADGERLNKNYPEKVKKKPELKSKL